jgi:hypothetical protein
MAQYTTKRKYTKKPTTKLKKVVRKVKKETVEAVSDTPVVKSFWQKTIERFKSIVK